MAKYACYLRGSPSERAALRAKRILDAGFEGIGLGHPFHTFDWEEIRPTLPREKIDSIDLFLPYPSSHPPGAPCPFHLDSSHPEEKRDAVKYGTETVLFADRSAIPFILVHPVLLEEVLRKQVEELPRNKRFSEGVLKIQALRAPEAKLKLDPFRSVLSKLLDVAARHGVKLALVPGGFIDEAPDLLEARACLKEFAGAPLFVWIDTFSHSMAEEFGAVDQLFTDLKENLVGATLRDMSPRKKPVLLGEGKANWDVLRPLLEASPLWLADPPEISAEGALKQSLEFFETLRRGPEVKLKPGFYLS